MHLTKTGDIGPDLTDFPTFQEFRYELVIRNTDKTGTVIVSLSLSRRASNAAGSILAAVGIVTLLIVSCPDRNESGTVAYLSAVDL